MVAVSTTRAAAKGTKRPSVVTGAVSSVIQASTSTLTWAGADDWIDTLPVSPSATRARFEVVQPGAGSVTAGAPVGGFPVDHASTVPGAPASLAVICTSRAAAPVAGTPVSPAKGSSTAPVPIVVSSTRLGVTVTKRPSAAPATLGRNHPSIDMATSASTVEVRATSPAASTGTITKPEPLSPGPATSTVAAADAGPPGVATVTWPAPVAPVTVTLTATALTPPAGMAAWPRTATATVAPAMRCWVETVRADATTTLLAPPGTTGSGSSVLGMARVVGVTAVGGGSSMGAASSWPWTGAGASAEARCPRSRTATIPPVTRSSGTSSTTARRR